MTIKTLLTQNITDNGDCSQNIRRAKNILRSWRERRHVVFIESHQISITSHVRWQQAFHYLWPLVKFSLALLLGTNMKLICTLRPVCVPVPHNPLRYIPTFLRYHMFHPWSVGVFKNTCSLIDTKGDFFPHFCSLIFWGKISETLFTTQLIVMFSLCGLSYPTELNQSMG